MSNENRIFLFDTTLRDGEQAPGMSMNINEKLEVAHQLARLGVDVIEAGFPIASDGDYEAVKRVAKEVQGTTIAGLARVKEIDLERAADALQYASRSRIHTFLATSDIHMEHKLKMTEEQVLENIYKGVSYARSLADEVEFSPEDGSRTRLEFMIRVVETAISAGATIINIPDTVGYATPEEFGAFIKAIKEGVPNMDQAIISVHCHNDLGLAVANSLSAIVNGARQVECSVNGIGERAGNAALEEVAMALLTRKDFYGKELGIHTEEIYRTSKTVSAMTGMSLQCNKAIVGKNAFAHESGIHQDGVLKERSTYEIMDPRKLGIVKDNLVLGKHSGRHAFANRLSQLGFELSTEDLNKAFKRFKDLADKKKEINDLDLEAIVSDEIKKIPERYALEYSQIFTGSKLVPTATIGLREEGREELIEAAAYGDGPIDAVFKAVDKLTGLSPELESYTIDAVTGGHDAMGEVIVRLKYNDQIFIGKGASTDVIEASAKAYINAVNKICFELM